MTTLPLYIEAQQAAINYEIDLGRRLTDAEFQTFVETFIENHTPEPAVK